jgi:hypothetical protein
VNFHHHSNASRRHCYPTTCSERCNCPKMMNLTCLVRCILKMMNSICLVRCILKMMNSTCLAHCILKMMNLTGLVQYNSETTNLTCLVQYNYSMMMNLTCYKSMMNSGLNAILRYTMNGLYLVEYKLEYFLVKLLQMTCLLMKLQILDFELKYANASNRRQQRCRDW